MGRYRFKAIGWNIGGSVSNRSRSNFYRDRVLKYPLGKSAFILMF